MAVRSLVLVALIGACSLLVLSPFVSGHEIVGGSGSLPSLSATCTTQGCDHPSHAPSSLDDEQPPPPPPPATKQPPPPPPGTKYPPPPGSRQRLAMSYEDAALIPPNTLCEAEILAMPEPPLPIIQPIEKSDTVAMTPEMIRAKFHKMYEPPEYVPGKSMRTPRPTHAKQPPPLAVVYNTTNMHELPETPINLRYIKNFLTYEEADYLIKVGLEIGLQSSTVLTPDGGQDYDLTKRSSLTAFIPWGYDAVTERVRHRVARMLNITVPKVKPLQVVRYLPGQLFYPHYDGNEVRELQYTVFGYLNDVKWKDGGETDFPHLGLRVQPEKGNALFWENFCPYRGRRPASLHQGLPTKTGVKFGLNIWISFDDEDKVP